MEYFVGALSSALLIAVAALIVQQLAHRRTIKFLLKQETRALDRARAAELRSAEQIDAMLDRVSTSPRLEVRESAASAPRAERPYISELPYHDAEWNALHAEPDDGEA